MPSVLQITDKDANGGGIRRAVELQADLLGRRGWHIERLRLGKGTACGGDIIVPPPHPMADRSWKWRVALARYGAACDVIHLHLGFSGLSPGFVTAAADLAPLVVNLHDISPFESATAAGLRDWMSGQILKPARARVWAVLCARATSVIAPSTFLAAQAAAAGIPSKRIRVVPHPVQQKAKFPVPPSEQPPITVHAGLLSPQKGAEVLIEAFLHLTRHDAKLLVLGDGPSAADMAAAVAARGMAERVIFAGQVDPVTVREEMAKARLVIHPSIIDEGLGLTGLEALAEGRPVAGFGTGGAADWLFDGQTGLRAAELTAEALAAVWQRLLDDDHLCDRLGAQGYELATTRFSPQLVGDALDATLRDAMREQVTS